MSAFSLEESLARAGKRLGDNPKRRTRKDRGTSRFPATVERCLTQLLHGTERPRFVDVHDELRRLCTERGLPTPTRSSIYNAVERIPAPAIPWRTLPDEVRQSLYNVDSDDSDDVVPGDQVVFHAFNYGSPRALSHASALPWLCLVRAERRRGWRPKSLALLRAVMRHRRLQ